MPRALLRPLAATLAILLFFAVYQADPNLTVTSLDVSPRKGGRG